MVKNISDAKQKRESLFFSGQGAAFSKHVTELKKEVIKPLLIYFQLWQNIAEVRDDDDKSDLSTVDAVERGFVNNWAARADCEPSEESCQLKGRDIGHIWVINVVDDHVVLQRTKLIQKDSTVSEKHCDHLKEDDWLESGLAVRKSCALSNGVSVAVAHEKDFFHEIIDF